jgi:hypothetical protein
MNLTPSEISDFERLEKVVEAGKQTFVAVGLALTEIRDRKLYRRDYSTFEAYCQDRWGWSRQRGSQLIQAAAVVEALPEKMSTVVDNERVARELAKLPVPQQKAVIKEAIKAGEPLTTPMVRAKLPPPPIVPKPLPPKPPTVPPSPKARPETKPDPEPERDKTGHPIPEKILNLWNEACGVQTLLSAISSVRGTLRKQEDGKVFAETNMSSAMAHLDQAYTDIKTALPYAVCPTCQGKLADTCTLCKGRGFISEHRWNTCVPREAKEMRFKSKKS